MKPINNNINKQNKNKNQNPLNLYSYNNRVTEQTVHSLREQANQIIESKIESGAIDPQSLPIIKEWLHELYLLECEISKRDRLYEEYKSIEHDADRFAQDIVYRERKSRTQKIKDEHDRKLSTIHSEEDELTKLQKENKKYLKEAKRFNKRIQAQKQKEINQAELDKLQERLKQEQIDVSQDTKDKLHQVAIKETEAAFEIRQIENDIQHKEIQANIKREQSNERIEEMFGQEKQKRKIAKEKMDEAWKNQSKAMVAEYSARIAKSERKMAEELAATHEARNKAYIEEQKRLDNENKTLKKATTAAKLKAKLDNIRNSALNDKSSKGIIDEYYNREKANWNNVSDIDSTISELNNMFKYTKDAEEKKIINNKIRAAKANKTKIMSSRSKNNLIKPSETNKKAIK